MSLLNQATSAEQYDVPTMDWQGVGTAASPHRKFLSRIINVRREEIEGLSVLDVGCGTGWLLAECLEAGAAEVNGIEPSKLAEVARRTAPGAVVIRRMFQSYDAHKKFDWVTFIMSTEHLPDLPGVLRKAGGLLKEGGLVSVVTGDMDAFCSDRFDYEVEVETLIEGKEAVSQTRRPSGYGTTTDIVRSVDYWQEAAEQAGLQTSVHRPVMADEQFVAAVPQYGIYEHKPIFQYFDFMAAGK